VCITDQLVELLSNVNVSFSLQFPQNGELILKRLVIQFRKGFKRNDKQLCLASLRFIAHLVNQQVVGVWDSSVIIKTCIYENCIWLESYEIVAV